MTMTRIEQVTIPIVGYVVLNEVSPVGSNLQLVLRPCAPTSQ